MPRFSVVPRFRKQNGTLPGTNSKRSENGWLEYDPFLLGVGLFSGALAVSFREGTKNGTKMVS